MFIFGAILLVVFFMFIGSMMNDAQKQAIDANNTAGNVTLASLISDSMLESWIWDPPRSTALKASPTPLKKKIKKDLFSNTTSDMLLGPTPADVQSDDSSVPSTVSKEYFVASLFERPRVPVVGDWDVVLGTFDHYDDENWSEFLVGTEVPLLVRMFLSDSSETVTISRKQKSKHKKDTKQEKKNHSPKDVAAPSLDSAYEVTVSTASWILKHESKFTLGESYIEHDLDGTDSKNVFFFSSPRLLIQNKLKNKWKTAIVRHFHEDGLNMTFIDRERLLMARRFFSRVS